MNYENVISMSERLELCRISHEKIKARKLAMEDVAAEVVEVDGVGVEEEEI